MAESLGETFFPLYPDRTYRRRNQRILIAQIESLAPRNNALLDPSIYGGGNGDVTWERVQKFYATLLKPEFPTRQHQLPMHYYMEYVGVQSVDDYFVYVGEPLTNRSTFLQEAVAAGVLPVDYADAILVALQENYGIETIETRLWQLLADRVITPLQRTFAIPRRNVRFFEQAADASAAASPSWPYRFRPPTYLDAAQLDLHLKYFEKR